MKKKFKKVLASAMAGIMALSVMMSPGLGTKVAKAAEEVHGVKVYTSGNLGESDEPIKAKVADSVKVAKDMSDVAITLTCAEDVSFNQYASIEYVVTVNGKKSAPISIKGFSWDSGVSHELTLEDLNIKKGDIVSIEAYTYSWEGKKDNEYVYITEAHLPSPTPICYSADDDNLVVADIVKDVEAIKTVDSLPVQLFCASDTNFNSYSAVFFSITVNGKKQAPIEVAGTDTSWTNGANWEILLEDLGIKKGDTFSIQAYTKSWDSASDYVFALYVDVDALFAEPEDTTEYEIDIVNDSGNGYVLASADKARKDTKIKLIPMADDGYGLKSWNVMTAPTDPNKEAEEVIVSENNTFKMPAANVKVTPVFDREYTIKVNAGANGTVEVAKKAMAGDSVAITVKPDAGYEIKEFKVVNGNTAIEVKDDSFTMPAADVEVQAEFKKATTFHAYIGIQTPFWAFRDSWDHAENGIKSGIFNQVTLDGQKVAGDITDVELVDDGTYTVSVKGLEFTKEQFGTQLYFNQLYVSTDLPNSDAIKISDVKLNIDGKEVENLGYVPEGDYISILCQNVYNDKLKEAYGARSCGEYDVPVKDISITFTIKGLDALKDAAPKYKVNVTSEGSGSASADVSNAEEGQEVTLGATAFSGYKFKEWKTTDVTITDNKFKMPAKEVSIVAVFEKIPEAAEPEKPADDKEVITETKFGPENITASNNYVLSSKDYPVNPVKLDLKLSFNKAFWNDWCQVFLKVDYDGKTKYIVYAGNQAKWNTTVANKTKDIVYVVPVSGKTKEGSEIVVDNYDIILMDSTGAKDAKFDYDLTIKEIAGCKDWSVTFYCPAWCDPDTVTLTDVDGKTKDLMAEVKDVYDAEGNKVLNDDGSTKTEPVITSKEDAYIYRASGIVYTSSKEVEKAPEPAKKGTALTVGAGKYKVTSADAKNPAVAFTAPKSKTAANVTIPDTIKKDGVTYKVTSVAANAFAKNTKVKKVVIGKNVKSIGAGAFSGCTKLATVTFKGTAVTSIGKNAFKGDKALKSIVITKKVKTIGASAFEGCTKLAKVTMKSTKLATVGNKAFAKCTALKSLTFPATCKKLGASVFTGDKKLKTLTLKSTKITTKTLNKNTFKGTVKTIKVKVPSKKVAAYKKLFATKGLDKKAKVTK